MMWFIIIIGLIGTLLLIKGGNGYFKEGQSTAHKRKGLGYMIAGAVLIMGLATWNEFVYKRSDISLQRDAERIEAVCQNVVKAFNKSQEQLLEAMDEMKMVQFPFLPKKSSKALGQCQFHIEATVEATYRGGGGTHQKTYAALVEYHDEAKYWQLLEWQWLD